MGWHRMALGHGQVVSKDMTLTIGILALQGDVREHAHTLEKLDVCTLKVRRPRDLEGIDGIIIPGGESTTMVKLLDAYDLFKPLQAAISSGLPAYGSCAGMIMLADRIAGGTANQRTIGGIDMTVQRNAFGSQTDSFETEIDFASDPEPVHAVFIRAPIVLQVGPDVEVLAHVSCGAKDRIVAVRQGGLLATAFHPEITNQTRIHRLFIDKIARG